MRLTVVGSAPAWARSPGRPSSCYVVEGTEDAIALDMGQGALGALHAVCPPSSLRAVVISHVHADHHIDLIPLRYVLRYGYAEPREVCLHAPPTLRARYDAFTGEPGFLDGLPGADLAPGTRVLGSLTLEIAPVTHLEASFCFRVSPTADPHAPGLVYSGDCGRWQDLLALIRPGDTLLCDAFWGTTTGDAAAQHLTATEAALAASTSRAGRLLLTHVEEAHDPPGAVEAARRTFEGEVLLATPGLVVETTPTHVVG